MNPLETGAGLFFSKILAKPWAVVVAALVLFIGAASFMPTIVKDTRGDAFLSPDNPALLYRDRVKEQFGLNDPVVVALTAQGSDGIYTPEALEIIRNITNKISALDNVNEDKVFSLATESNISGTDQALDVELFFGDAAFTEQSAAQLKGAIEAFPLYHGSIVSKDAKVALVIAELHNQDISSRSYQEILNLVNQEVAPLFENSGIKVHVAGEGAIAGYLGDYIDKDTQVLNPLAGLVIFILIILGFSRFAVGFFGLMMIATTVLTTIGLMAAFNVPFFVITNALPVILIGIAVADTIHIFSCYFELQARNPHVERKLLVIEAMSLMWRPVTLTSLTTIAGFLGLYFAAYMPPFKYFGLFAALGVSLAWLYSLTLLPAVMTLLPIKGSKRFLANFTKENKKIGVFTRVSVFLGRISLARPLVTLCLGFAVIALGIYTSSQVEVDEDRIKTFHEDEAIYQADAVINRHTNGANNLDIIIETQAVEGLFDIATLRKIEALQDYALTFESVKSANSIVDYLKQMNSALNESSASAYVLPESKEIVAQYFLLYSASGSSDDFDEEVDYNYQIANVRLTLDSGGYANNKPIVEALQNYVDREFSGSSVSATLTGRVTVDYFWIRDLKASHYKSLGVALFLVWLISVFLFRSILAGIFTLIPVVTSLLFVYSAMVFMKIPLGIGTSMFASVAIGLGVDFSIHTIERLKKLFSDTYENNPSDDIDGTIMKLFPSTGRALFFNYLTVACGFGVLMASKVVPLTDFGAIVVVAVSGSFICSMTLLPALVKTFRPGFILGTGTVGASQSLVSSGAAALLVALFFGGVIFSNETQAGKVETLESSESKVLLELPASDVIDNVLAVEDGNKLTRSLTMTLINKKGFERVRETTLLRKTIDGVKKTKVLYESPSNVKGTAFLTYDYKATDQEDDQWLYLPATKKSRRISSSNRGDYFLGTDFTYEDIKNEGKLEPKDYTFKHGGIENIKGKDLILIFAQPKSSDIKKELGYSKVEFLVDPKNWIIMESRYWDTKDRALKTIYVKDLELVDGIWSRKKITAVNHKTKHTTQFDFYNIDYSSDVNEASLSKHALARS